MSVGLPGPVSKRKAPFLGEDAERGNIPLAQELLIQLTFADVHIMFLVLLE